MKNEVLQKIFKFKDDSEGAQDPSNAAPPRNAKFPYLGNLLS